MTHINRVLHYITRVYPLLNQIGNTIIFLAVFRVEVFFDMLNLRRRRYIPVDADNNSFVTRRSKRTCRFYQPAILAEAHFILTNADIAEHQLAQQSNFMVPLEN